MKRMKVLGKEICILEKEEADRYERFVKYYGMLQNNVGFTRGLIQKCTVIRNYFDGTELEYQEDVLEAVDSIGHNLEAVFNGSPNL